MARLLIDRGYRNVRPLAGGLEAWVAAGYETEAVEGAEAASEFSS
ncbi:MAG TPA: hypothetical protein VFV54_10705 [Thermoanaerobaculia bacterium]|nr:hypothetical protein [Thermoanaerobaculia bacterium]